jgi:hypothetical protein
MNEDKNRTRPDQFGGPVGALVLSIVMPTITFYLWSAIAQHGGSLWLPSSVAEVLAMVPLPTWDAAVVFGAWLALQAILYVVVPGRVVQGRPSPAGECAEYRINGLAAFSISVVVLVVLIAVDVVSPSAVLRHWGPLLTICTLFAIGAAALCYVTGRRRAHLERSNSGASTRSTSRTPPSIANALNRRRSAAYAAIVFGRRPRSTLRCVSQSSIASSKSITPATSGSRARAGSPAAPGSAW